MKYLYHEVQGTKDGETEVLFGSFSKTDCKYELKAERVYWHGEGYRNIKIVSSETEEIPDPSVYSLKEIRAMERG